jgi:outer membrane protein OmpA-like peptidoglycan-associated protein/tetratricopeptide (TPR) repeat protein
MKSLLSFIILITLACFNGKAQPLPQGTSQSKKAQKQFDDALNHYAMRDYAKAEEVIDKALKTDPDFIDALLLKADLRSAFGDATQSIALYEKIIQLEPRFYIAYFSLGKEAYRSANYEKAQKALQGFMQFRDLKPSQVNAARFMLDNCRFAIQSMKNPVPFNPINIDSSINTSRDEYFPGITADEQTFIFTRLLVKGGDEKANKKTVQNPYLLNEDFYMSKKNKQQHWMPSFNIGEPVNTPDNEGAVTISADGQYLFFTACNREGGYGSCDIYFSYLDGDTWTKPRNIGAPVNTNAWESQPSLSYDGKTLYFSSNRPGGQGDMDLWMTKFENGKWTNPINLGDKINTPASEQSPYIHKDDKTLYFSSNGHIGMGDLDLFMSAKQADGTWDYPKNLGYPINSNQDELALTISGNGIDAYYASEMPGGKGGLDIYRFELPPSARPQGISYVKGVIYDNENKRKLRAKVELLDLATGKLLVETYANRKTGEFLVCLPANKNYALNVSHEGYLFHSENFSLINAPATSPFLLDVPMKPIKSGQIVVLKNVFFDTDKFDLKDESRTELDKLVAFLQANPLTRIEVSGHTDNQGNKAKNQTLSQNRAKAVTDYLTTKGIAKERLTAKGYADDKPIADNSTEAGRAQNRRTEFRTID